MTIKRPQRINPAAERWTWHPAFDLFVWNHYQRLAEKRESKPKEQA